MSSNRSPTSPVPQSSPSPTPTPESLSEGSTSGRESRSKSATRTPQIELTETPSPQWIENSSEDTGTDTDTNSDTSKKMILINSEKFQLVKVLGEGSFGRVYSIVGENGKHFAAKLFKKKNDSEDCDGDDSIRAETEIFHRLGSSSHRSVLRMYKTGMVQDPPTGFFQNVLLMPEVGDSIGDVLEKAKRLDAKFRNENCSGNERTPKVSMKMNAIQLIGKQICEGMEFLSRHHIFHRDLKPYNVFFTKKIGFAMEHNASRFSFVLPKHLSVKIGDYGEAKIITDWDFDPETVQTKGYRAPEILLGISFKSNSDVWSTVLTILELYVGTDIFQTRGGSVPWETERIRSIQYVLGQRISTGLWKEAEQQVGGEDIRENLVLFDDGKCSSDLPTLLDHKRSYHADSLFEFVQFALIVDYNHRPSFQDLSSHIFFKTTKN
ncbi:hypothetical protein GCK72_022061 [Caenorhabditis remanei]|uniref:Protein kinase domain-containing protein n=1 Tax=Caenorhabditis remanei TaxID=31234 RepID=A0A6A5FSS1_CAERE|nr:hypothetical protein GCK72_022061 [Caenorhabditis remanei]KAF1745614.1 hypothetical protein GCK72_022061 [Caenorhabditis remanei]